MVRDSFDEAQVRRRQGPAEGSRWRHYRGNVYVVVTTSVGKRSGAISVVYRNPSTGDVWDCPVEEWAELVQVEPGGLVAVPRFVPLPDAPPPGEVGSLEGGVEKVSLGDVLPQARKKLKKGKGESP